MVAEHVFAVNTNHLWKECNPKHNTLLTEFMKQNIQLTTEGQLVYWLKLIINLLDGSLFNSSLIFRNLKTKLGIFSHKLGGTGGLHCTEYMFCRKRMTTGPHESLLSFLLRQAGPGRALNQCLVIL